MKEELIEKIIYKNSNGNRKPTYREIYRLNDVVVKIEIIADECTAGPRIYVLDTNSFDWKCIYHIPMNIAKVTHWSEKESDFKPDIIKLKNMLNKILNIKEE